MRYPKGLTTSTTFLISKATSKRNNYKMISILIKSITYSRIFYGRYKRIYKCKKSSIIIRKKLGINLREKQFQLKKLIFWKVSTRQSFLSPRNLIFKTMKTPLTCRSIQRLATILTYSQSQSKIGYMINLAKMRFKVPINSYNHLYL